MDKNTQAYRTDPESGQLIEVWRLQWVVADVLSSKLTAPSAQQNAVNQEPQEASS